MGYYPIKCIHCMRALRMEDRCVKLEPGEIKSPDSGLGTDFDLSGGIKTNKAIRYKSLAQLREEGVIEKEETLRIDISREYRNDQECQKDFVQSIMVKDLEVNGKKRSGKVSRFYCPYCHSEIIPLAGKLPIYLVSLLGPSSAGKTVYLTILHMLLSGKIYRLPQGVLSFENLGAMRKEFQNFALDIRRKNTLPSTTTENRKDPYLLRISYKADANATEANKQCLLGLIDMRGEMLHGEHNDDLLDYNVPQFKEANGFIMMVDPETLEGVYNHLPEQDFGGRKIEQLNQTLSSMKEAIMECITAEMGQIQRPSVVALAKEDILLKNYSQLGIPLTQPVIAPQFRMVPGTHLGRNYYEPMNASTRACIQYLSGSFTAFLEDTFRNPYFLSLSALGSYVRISGNKVDNFEKIRPLRVEEPLLRLLMEFNFVPKFYREEYFAAPGDFMQIWGEQYAERWTEKAPEENAAKKRRWSR